MTKEQEERYGELLGEFQTKLEERILHHNISMRRLVEELERTKWELIGSCEESKMTLETPEQQTEHFELLAEITYFGTPIYISIYYAKINEEISAQIGAFNTMFITGITIEDE